MDAKTNRECTLMCNINPCSLSNSDCIWHVKPQPVAAELTPEQAVKTIDLKQAKEMTLIVVSNDGKVETVGTSFLKQFFSHIESQGKYADIGKAFVAHQREVPCDFGYNDEDCQCADCCDTIRRLCELSAEVD